jgi:hypothetical protein
MEHHNSYTLPIKCVLYHPTKLTQRIPFLLQRLLSNLMSHSSQTPPPPLKKILDPRRPHQSMLPPLPKDIVPVWETVPQPLTQIPFFYPPPGIEDFQVAAMLTLPNMVLAIVVWYLHPPEMVPRPSLPPQEGIPMMIPILTPTTPPLTNPLPQLGVGERRRIPPLHFLHASHHLAHYVRKRATKPTTVHHYLNYGI